MDWMSGVLDRFYSTDSLAQPQVAIKEEVLDSLDLDADLYCNMMAETELATPEGEAPRGPAGAAVTSAGQRPSKECGVCGDKALGYNFNAITCESCKAFFRRNALKTKTFRCPFADNCNIDVVTRRFCQKCRLRKCYTIGMKKEWIMTEEERKVKRQKIEQNRHKKVDPVPPQQQQQQDSPSYSAELSPAAWSPHSPTSPYPYRMASPLAPAAGVGAPPAAAAQEAPPLRHNSGDAPLQQQGQALTHRGVQVPEAAETTTSIDDGTINMTTILGMALRAEFSSTQLREPVLPTGELNAPERDKIQELLEAYQALMAPLNEDNLFVNLVNTDPSLINVINLCDIAIRRLIKMSKKISSFRSLCQKDQIALLKGGCTELMILHSVTTYDAENNSWNIRANETDYTSIHLNVLKKAPFDVYEEHKQFNRTFSQHWKSDPYIMGIISAITLFSPARPNLEHTDVISLEQESYYYLLRRYLLTTMSPCEARSEFLKLIRKLEELHRLNEDHIKIFMNVDPHLVEPLLIEIFDLKCGRTFGVTQTQQQPTPDVKPPLL